MYQKSYPETIQAMFASIAQHYDKANTIFTFGLHKKWNEKLINEFVTAKCLLDLCAGTGEIAFGVLKRNPTAEAILLDFCPEMLAIAQKRGAPFNGRFEIVQADAQALPFADGSVDCVSISYGIRNVKEPAHCFREVYRVLSPGGRFGILELTRPTSKILRIGHRFYTRLIIPLLGKIVTNNKEAYRYLVNSVESFAAPEILEALLREAGFQEIHCSSLFGGIATLFSSLK
jgi:demethylmenaquinone methyltransferase / 2-methoxy-6-polyprenyl-1,4-benzoquinol methylase